MAKDWARQLYNSKAWKRLREYCYARDFGVCVMCGMPAEHCDHITELSPENLSDPDVALNPDNCQMLCWDCHNKKTIGALPVADGLRFDENGALVEMNRGKKSTLPP